MPLHPAGPVTGPSSHVAVVPAGAATLHVGGRDGAVPGALVEVSVAAVRR